MPKNDGFTNPQKKQIFWVYLSIIH